MLYSQLSLREAINKAVAVLVQKTSKNGYVTKSPKNAPMYPKTSTLLNHCSLSRWTSPWRFAKIISPNPNPKTKPSTLNPNASLGGRVAGVSKPRGAAGGGALRGAFDAVLNPKPFNLNPKP